MPRDLAIVLNDGSVNSAVITALAAQKYKPVMVHIESAPSMGRRGQAFDLQVQHFKPARSQRLAMPFLAGIASGDSRLAEVDARAAHNSAGKLVEMMPLIGLGLRLAVHHDASTLFIGLRFGPECADLPMVIEHTQVWNELTSMMLGRDEPTLSAPLLELEPWEVVDLGVQLGAPLGLTWSCDQVVTDPCGRCLGCRRREESFTRSGRPDPLKVARRAAG